MIKEIWADIEGYEGFYRVSNRGRVLSLRWGIPKIRKPGDNGSGYVTMTLYKGTTGKAYTMHGLVAAAFIGPRPKGFDINHIDGNKGNNTTNNLEYITHGANQKHAAEIGLTTKGERNPMAKLNESGVKQMRKMATDGTDFKVIASIFGVTRSTVYYVVTFRTWKHVI